MKKFILLALVIFQTTAQAEAVVNAIHVDSIAPTDIVVVPESVRMQRSTGTAENPEIEHLLLYAVVKFSNPCQATGEFHSVQTAEGHYTLALHKKFGPICTAEQRPVLVTVLVDKIMYLSSLKDVRVSGVLAKLED